MAFQLIVKINDFIHFTICKIFTKFNSTKFIYFKIMFDEIKVTIFTLMIALKASRIPWLQQNLINLFHTSHCRII